MIRIQQVAFKKTSPIMLTRWLFSSSECFTVTNTIFCAWVFFSWSSIVYIHVCIDGFNYYLTTHPQNIILVTFCGFFLAVKASILPSVGYDKSEYACFTHILFDISKKRTKSVTIIIFNHTEERVSFRQKILLHSNIQHDKKKQLDVHTFLTV